MLRKSFQPYEIEEITFHGIDCVTIQKHMMGYNHTTACVLENSESICKEGLLRSGAVVKQVGWTWVFLWEWEADGVSAGRGLDR